jgi:Protein kinase domain
MFQVARAVRFLHTGGCDNLKIFHRDIKSGNICLTQDYTAKLIDCGMSKFVPEDEKVSHGESVTPTILNSSGATVFGTPGYICPNYQRRFGRVSFTAACDVYSMGVTFTGLIVGCLQDGQSSRSGQDFDDYYNRYVVDEFGEKVDDGINKLIGDADPVAEWNASTLNPLCELTYQCMAPSPMRRPTTQRLIQKLGGISQTDFRGTIVRHDDPPQTNVSVNPMTSAWCVLCHESVAVSITCSDKHTICIPCIEQQIQDHIGRSGDDVLCGIVGCNAPLKDDSLCGKISTFTFTEYVRERERQKGLDNILKVLGKNHQQVMMSLSEIRSVAQRTLKGLAYLATENGKKCPTLVWIVPAERIDGRSARDWVKWARRATTHRRYNVYFVCQHSFTAFDLEPKMEIDVPRSWIVQAAPVLRLSIFAIKAALSALGPLPFPVPDFLPKEQIAMAEELVNSFLDDTTTKLCTAFESACTSGVDLPQSESSQLMTLTGPAYEGIAEKATWYR